MALFTKFELPAVAKAAKVEKVESPVIQSSQDSQDSQLSQPEQIEKSPTLSTHRPCYCCKGTNYWLAGTEKYPHWV